jgi:hypothetical protein
MSIDLGNFIEFCAKKRKNNNKQAFSPVCDVCSCG